MIKELILKNRSYRRFYEDYFIDTETLRSLIELARSSPSARNLQPLRYIISNNRELNEKIFQLLKWAGYLGEKGTPQVGERPSAYIIVLGDKSLTTNFYCDHGIATQSILLGAVELGLGGCIIASVDQNKLRNLLNISDRYEIFHVIALGKPKEKVVIENLNSDGDIKYWRDENQVHHVPKRSLDELILKIYE